MASASGARVCLGMLSVPEGLSYKRGSPWQRWWVPGTDSPSRPPGWCFSGATRPASLPCCFLQSIRVSADVFTLTRFSLAQRFTEATEVSGNSGWGYISENLAHGPEALFHACTLRHGALPSARPGQQCVGQPLSLLSLFSPPPSSLKARRGTGSSQQQKTFSTETDVCFS